MRLFVGVNLAVALWLDETFFHGIEMLTPGLGNLELDATGLELDEGPLSGLEVTEESPEDRIEDGLVPETEDELVEPEVGGGLAAGIEDDFEPGVDEGLALGVDEGLAPGVEDGVGIPTGLELGD